MKEIVLRCKRKKVRLEIQTEVPFYPFSERDRKNKIKNEIVGAKKVGQSDLGCHVRAADGRPMGRWAGGPMGSRPNAARLKKIRFEQKMELLMNGIIQFRVQVTQA